MAAPAGTITNNAIVTLSAPGNTNGDATLIAAAFNGVIFPAISGAAAVASASSAVVTITWDISKARVANQTIADTVTQVIVTLKASLNASVTGIQVAQQATIS